MLEAGHTCVGFGAPDDHSGSPFSTGRDNDDCSPLAPGTLSVCNENAYKYYRALCYCEDGKYHCHD